MNFHTNDARINRLNSTPALFITPLCHRRCDSVDPANQQIDQIDRLNCPHHATGANMYGMTKYASTHKHTLIVVRVFSTSLLCKLFSGLAPLPPCFVPTPKLYRLTVAPEMLSRTWGCFLHEVRNALSCRMKIQYFQNTWSTYFHTDNFWKRKTVKIVYTNNILWYE